MENNEIQINDEFFNHVELPNSNLKNILESLKIDPKKEVTPPEIIWQIKILNTMYTLGTKGNFSLIIGKAKSKKSFFINLILSKFIQFQKQNSNGKILYFDTEQSEYHVSLAVKRICKKVGFISDNIETFHLRSKSPAERLALIEFKIYDTENLEFVVIDGIKDLITSINDEEQASMIATKLLKWSEEKNIHIITVLHQNKSDANARGHVGTELQNKAETVLSITKSDENKNVSIVEAVYCRNIEPEAFAFEVDENGLPNMIDDFKKPETSKKSNKLQVNEIDKRTYIEILTEAFKNNPELKYSELQIQIDLAIQKISGVDFGATAIQKAIVYVSNLGLIKKNGKDRSPKAFYTLIQETEEQKKADNNQQNELDI